MTSVLFSCLFSWTSLFFPIETTSDEESQPESPTTKQAGQWRTLWLLLLPNNKAENKCKFSQAISKRKPDFFDCFSFQLNCAYQHNWQKIQWLFFTKNLLQI